MYAELDRRLRCSRCGETKEVTAFSPRSDRPKGYESRCKECNSKRALEYHRRKRDEILPKMRKRAVTRYAKDSSVAKFWGRTRKKHIKKVTPKWADKAAIRAIYLNCPEGMQVDHIVPIKGKTVSGLHVEYNLQYLTPAENNRKKNKLLK